MNTKLRDALNELRKNGIPETQKEYTRGRTDALKILNEQGREALESFYVEHHEDSRINPYWEAYSVVLYYDDFCEMMDATKGKGN